MSMIGKTLGTFQCTELLGKGGMGEVYKAKDQKLGRDVAIKVLPEEFAKDTDRVARFQREAKLLASLNHPNIAAIHGLEESDGTHFLVLELIEGDTLADRLKRGAIPVEESLKLALQIAEALEAAHEKGVIHRDLKPANIKVTPDGKVKVLDFGLAKAFAGDQSEMILSDSPTLSVAATQQGIILGTAAYMSPEQAKGKTVDKKTDIWSFGTVLYEMLIGKAAFQSDEVSEILASVIKGGTNLDLLPKNIHHRIRELLSRCLQKDMRRRYADIADARYEIEQTLADPSGVFAQPSVIAKPRKQLRVGISWVAAIAILCIIIAGAAVWYLRPMHSPEPKQVIRFEYELPEGQQFSYFQDNVIALSSDGTLLAYCTSEGLYWRSMDDWTTKFLAGTEGAMCPFFSPDGQWIGYISQTEGKLKKIAISGGTPLTLCNASTDGGFSWTSDNRIIHASGSKILWVSADGGDLEPLFEEKGNNTLGVPQMLPEGKSVLFTSGGAPPHKIIAHSLESGESRELFEGGFAHYVKTGHIVYGVENDLYARPFNPDKLKVTGGPIHLVEGVMSGNWVWHYAVSDTGTLIYIPGATAFTNKKTLVWVDREGREESISSTPDDFRAFNISPDGTQIAASVFSGGNQDIHIWNIARKTPRKLTFDESDEIYPLWTPNGESIVFGSNRADGVGIFKKSADGTGEVDAIGSLVDYPIAPCSWSEDGEYLVLLEGEGYGIGMLNMEGNQDIKTLLKERRNVYWPRISPNGQWIVYASDEPGQTKIYVRPFPEVDSGQWPISTNIGGMSPLWSRDGKELFYWTDNALMVVTVENNPTFIPGKPEVQFQRTPVFTGSLGITGIPWDIHPDGKRFLMLKQTAETDVASSSEASSKIKIVTNWFEELKEMVPKD